MQVEDAARYRLLLESSAHGAPRRVPGEQTDSNHVLGERVHLRSGFVSDNCFICETPGDGTALCEDCEKSFHGALDARKGRPAADKPMELMKWAVRRARHFERKRAALERGPVARPLGEARMSRVE